MPFSILLIGLFIFYFFLFFFPLLPSHFFYFFFIVIVVMFFITTFTFIFNFIFANFNFNLNSGFFFLLSFSFLFLFLLLMHYLCSIHYFFKHIFFFFIQSILGPFIFPFLHTHEKCYHLLPQPGMIDDVCLIHVHLQQLVLNLHCFCPNNFHTNEIFNLFVHHPLAMLDHFFHSFPNHCH